MSFVQWLPWCLLAIVLAIGFWQRRRYMAELETRHHTEETLHTTKITLRRISQAVEKREATPSASATWRETSLYHNRAHVELFGYTVDELNAVPEGGALFADKNHRDGNPREHPVGPLLDR